MMPQPKYSTQEPDLSRHRKLSGLAACGDASLSGPQASGEAAENLHAATIESLCNQLETCLEQITHFHRLARLIDQLDEPAGVLERACDELRLSMAFGWVAAVFTRAGVSILGQKEGFLSSGQLPLDEGPMRSLCQAVPGRIWGGRATTLLQKGEDPLASAVGGEVLVQPIYRDGRLIAALIAGGKAGPEAEASSVEMQSMAATAEILGSFLDNVARYAEQRSLFYGMLQAMTASIDAKDPYTRGHSERVAAIAKQLAHATGLEDDRVEHVRLAGLLHDVGKIGVPEAVLCKCGRLTDDEYDQIKRHPVIGHRILQDIPLPQGVLPAVLHHHERTDGRGYPHGLKGPDIPDFAKMLAVADTFDAMSSTRSYRAAMPRIAVLAEMRRVAGTQLDPDLVEAFMSLNLAAYDTLLEEAQAAALSGVTRAAA